VVLVAGNGDSIFKRLMKAIGREDLGRRPGLAHNAGRVARVAEIDAAIERLDAAARGGRGAGALDRRRACRPAGLHRRRHRRRPALPGARHAAEQTTRDGHRLEVPGIVPKLLGTPGRLRRPAPRLGEDSDAVLAGLGLSAEQIADLRERGIVAR
jgi:formyl-CoA transferase